MGLKKAYGAMPTFNHSLLCPVEQETLQME